MPQEQTGIVMIHGREYQTVALRVRKFREQHPDWSLTSEIIQRDDMIVVMRSSIADPAGRVLATGHAEEVRSASQINETSALENCETSAHGRALAALGFGGSEFASADEVANAIHQQAQPPAVPRPAPSGPPAVPRPAPSGKLGDFFVDGVVGDYQPPKEGKSGRYGPAAFTVGGMVVKTFDGKVRQLMEAAYSAQVPAKVWYEKKTSRYGMDLWIVDAQAQGIPDPGEFGDGANEEA